MKVLHVIPSVSKVHGGPTRAIEMMEYALNSVGVTVDTATTDDDGPGSRLKTQLCQPIPHLGGNRWYFKKNTEFYKASWSFASWIIRNVRLYDVVHVHAMFSFTSVLAAWSARRAGVPYVIRPLGVLTRYGVTQRRPLFKRISLRLIEGALLRDASAVHFTSEAERDEALYLGIPMKPVIIPLGVLPNGSGLRDRFDAAHKLPPNPSRLVYLSRIDPKKNLEGLIRALGLLAKNGSSPLLLVGGQGKQDYVDSLKSLAVAEGVNSQIVWLGHVSGQDKFDLLSAGDIFVLPSHSENFGIAVVEALFAGLPCVLGRGVALANQVHQVNAGITVNSDAPSIANGISYYLRDTNTRLEASHAAVKLAIQEFSVQNMGNRLKFLYDSSIRINPQTTA